MNFDVEINDLFGRTMNLLPMFTISIKPLGRMVNTVRSCNYGVYPKIATDKFLNISYFFFWNFNRLKQVKLTLLKHQIRFSLYVRQIIRIVTNKRNFQSAIYSPYRYFALFVSKHTAVVSNTTKWLKSSLNFLIQLVTISNFRNTSDNHLRGKIERRFYRVVYFMVDFVLSPNFLFKTSLRNFIAGSITLFQSIFKSVRLFIIRQQFYLQCQFHGTNIIHLFEIPKFNLTLRRQFLPPSEERWVSLPKYL